MRGSILARSAALSRQLLRCSSALPQAHAAAEVNLQNDSSDLELHTNMHQTEMLHHIWVRSCKLMHRSSRCCRVARVPNEW